MARLLGMSVDVICQAAFRGDLRARIVGHDVVDIRRADILAWRDADDPHRPSSEPETARQRLA